MQHLLKHPFTLCLLFVAGVAGLSFACRELTGIQAADKPAPESAEFKAYKVELGGRQRQ